MIVADISQIRLEIYLTIRKYLIKSCVYNGLNVTSEHIWPHCMEKYT